MKLDSNTTALVTGANGGLGEAIARKLHARSVKLVLSARRPEAVEGLAAELGARIILADQSSAADVSRLIEEAADVDVAILNAASPATGYLFGLEEKAIEDMVRVNLTSPILTARGLGVRMAARGRGHLVLVSSISGMVANPGASMYAATKFGLRGFAMSLRAELHGSGVGVSTIYPGFIRDAGMFASTKVELPPGVGTRAPDDVAVAVVRSIERNKGEVTVAAVDQRVAAFAAAVAPSAVDFIASRSSTAKRLSADVIAGHQKAAERRRS